MIQVQFDLFKEDKESEFEELEKVILEVKKSSDKVRRGMFAKHGELVKMFLDIDERLKVIEKNICKGC